MFKFALTVVVKFKVVFLCFMKIYGGVEVQHHAFLTLSLQPQVLAPQPPGANPCYELILKQNLKKLCCWCRLIDCVGSCVDCNECLAFMNWLMLFNCHYLKNNSPTYSCYIASKMLICFILCPKFVQNKQFFITFMPKCLSDIKFCESKGTWSVQTVPVCMLWHYKFVCVSWRTWQKILCN